MGNECVKCTSQKRKCLSTKEKMFTKPNYLSQWQSHSTHEPRITLEVHILYPVFYATDNGLANSEALEKETIALQQFSSQIVALNGNETRLGGPVHRTVIEMCIPASSGAVSPVHSTCIRSGSFLNMLSKCNFSQILPFGCSRIVTFPFMTCGLVFSSSLSMTFYKCVHGKWVHVSRVQGNNS